MPNVFGDDYQRLVEIERDGIRLSQNIAGISTILSTCSRQH